MKTKIFVTLSFAPFVVLFVFLFNDYICACGPIDEFGISHGITPEEDGIRLTREKIFSKIPKGSTIEVARNQISVDYYKSNCIEDFQNNLVSCSFDIGKNRLGFYSGYEILFILNDKKLIEDIHFNFFSWHLQSSSRN